jgi:uncharacterized protein (TIGR02246 family)
MRKLVLMFIVAGIMFVGCNQTPASLTAQDIAAIKELDNTINKALLAKDADLFLSCFADDMAQLTAYGKTEGKEQFSKDIKEMFDKYVKEFKIEEAKVEKVEGAGNYAYMWTVSKGSTHPPEGDPWVGLTRTLKVVRKNANGKWEIVADGMAGFHKQ